MPRLRLRPLPTLRACATAATLVLVATLVPSAASAEPRAVVPGDRVAPAAVTVGSLTTEHLVDPLGIDAPRPRLGWTLTSEERGVVQSAYQVQVSTDDDFEGELAWDSGRVDSDNSIGVAYDGAALRSATRYHWRVRVWDGDDEASGWSGPAWFETGLLEVGDWSADWIAPGTERDGGSYLRGELDLPADVASARLYVSGRGNYERGPDGQGICCEQQFGLARGIYEPWLNGQRVSASEIESTGVDTRVRALYRTYDVTDLVVEGENALGLMIGEDSDVLAQLEVTTADGEMRTLATDASWRSTPGPVARAHRFHGEQYDARAEVDGWSEPGADTAAWQQVRVSDEDAGRLDAAMFEPMEVVADHEPVEVTEPEPGVYVLDFGQNRSGWTRIDLDLSAGTEVSLKHGERLSDGRVDNRIIGARQTNTFTAAGGQVTWEPSFVYAGFRWVEVTGLPKAPEAGDIVAREVHNAVRSTGGFESDDALLDRLHVADRQTQVNGLHAIPEDTPTREKRGWTADAHIAAEALINNYGMAAFYSNWSDEHVAAQRPDGRIPDIVPTEPSDSWHQRSDPAWGASHFLIPLYVYQEYGDARLLTEHYSSLRSYVDYLGTTTEGGLVTDPAHRWGNDWLGVEETNSTLFRSGFYYWALRTVAQAAEITGRPGEAAELEQRADEVAAAINGRFLDESADSYGPSQFANAFPLTLGIVPDASVDGVVQTLVDDVVDERDGHFTGGLPGIKYIPEALAMHGRSDVVLDVVRSTEYPGWGYMLENGPGTIWEDWNGNSSLNHPMFSSIDDWIYTGVAGIDQAPGSVGYQQSVIDPQVTDEVTEGSATVTTPYGELTSTWHTDDGQLVQEVVVPGNTTASVHVPADDPAWVFEAGRPVASQPGVIDVTRSGGDVVVEVGSGRYELTVDPLGGRLLQARQAVAGAQEKLRGSGVRPPASRTLPPRARQALSAVDAGIEAHDDGDDEHARAHAADALGHLQRLLDGLRRHRQREHVTSAAARAVRTDVARAQEALTAVIAADTGVAATLTTDGLIAGTTGEVTLTVTNGGDAALGDVAGALDLPDDWTATTTEPLPARLKPGNSATGTFAVAIPADAAGDQTIDATVTALRSGRGLRLPVTLPVAVAAPVVLTGVTGPRLIEQDATTTEVVATVRNRTDSAVDASVAVSEHPSGWTAPDPNSVSVPAGTDVEVPLRLTRPEDAGGGEVEIEMSAFDTTWGTASTDVFVRTLDCADDPQEEACLSADAELLHSFETGTEGWSAGDGSSSVSAVTSMANGPGTARLGRGMLEALPAPGVLSNEWRTTAVELDEPHPITPDQVLVVGLNSYGGTTGPYYGRIRVTDSAGLTHEVEQRITPDSWNELRMPLEDWDGSDIAAIEVGFRASGTGPWAGRFQLDMVVLDPTPPGPDPTDNLAAGRPVESRATLNCCGWSEGALVDGARTSSGSSRGYTSDPPRDTPDAVEWVQVDLGSTQDIGQLWLWPRTATSGEPEGNGGAGFPEDFRIEVSDDGASWTTAARYTGQSSDGSTGQGYDVAASGRYVRVVVERLGRPAPDEAGRGFHRLQLAELEVYATG